MSASDDTTETSDDVIEQKHPEDAGTEDDLVDSFEGDDGADGAEGAKDDDGDDDDDVAVPARAEDDEEEDDDDVEADLDAILKDRIAAGDDDDEDEDGVVTKPPPVPGSAEAVQLRKENEFSCPHCFLLVHSEAVHDGECPHCGGPVTDPA